MRTLLHVTAAKIKRGIGKSLFQSIAALVSAFVISFLLCFIISLEELRALGLSPEGGITGTESSETIDSLNSFFRDIVFGISLISVALILLTLFSLFIYVRLRTEESKRFFATLTSIGATDAQGRFISAVETLALYGLPITLGSFLGILPSGIFADMIARIFISSYSASPTSVLVPVLLSVLGTALVLAFTRTPRTRRKGSVIKALRAHNEREAGEAHNYRNSYTFRHMPVEKRIAKKSVAYYADTYRRITFMFISCVMYPVLAILFFALVSEKRVTDYTPEYGIDATALAEIFAGNIATFGALALLALTVFGVLQTVYMIKAHNRIRRDTLATYKSIGMTDESIRKVLKYEYGTAVFHAVIYLIFILVFITAFIGTL